MPYRLVQNKLVLQDYATRDKVVLGLDKLSDYTRKLRMFSSYHLVIQLFG